MGVTISREAVVEEGEDITEVVMIIIEGEDVVATEEAVITTIDLHQTTSLTKLISVSF